MKAVVKLFIIWIVFCNNAQSQNASISEQKIKMKTFMFSDPNPIPDMEKNYPYFKYDGFTNESIEKEWNMVILENDYIKVYIATEIGGKIWGAIEKSTGGEFLYFNDVVKFRDIAHRGPWTSGGLEYNFGIMSHVSTCSTPQDYVLSENSDGSVSCTIGAIDLHTQTKWNVEVLLPKDKAFVKTRASWFNTNKLPVTYYHYMNAAAKTAGNLEFIYPGSHHIGHGGEAGEWPLDNGRTISFYENNNFGSYKSYHVLNAYSDFMGGYWHDDNFGFGHLVDYDDLPGKKLWLWGLAEEGMIWEGLLTDTKGQYIEFQSGKSFNQAMSKSSLTPFKHREFIPYDADITTELWFPLKETGGMVAASEYGVLNVIKHDGLIEIIISALQDIDTRMVVHSGGEMVRQEEVALGPLDLFSSKVEMDPAMDFTIELGDKLLYYSSKKEDLIVDRPIEPNEEFDWNSAIGLFTQGFEIEKQQSYISGGHANKKAHELYLKSLELDPAFAPALNRLALSFYKRLDYKQALDYVLKSLAIDTYDAEANYFFGLINTKLNKMANAKSGFSIAVQSPLYRTAGYTELARLHLEEKKFEKAAHYAHRALAFNRYNVIALEVLALSYLQKSNLDMFNEILEKLYELDKTSTFVRYEKIRTMHGDMAELNQLVTNELPHESYLQLAIKFYNYGFPDESIEILKAAPRQTIIMLWLAYLDSTNEKDWLESGLKLSPDLVFPYRDETLVVLEHLMQISDDWKLKYYGSLIYWKKECIDQARNLFEQCGEEPDYAPFYLAKAKLYKDDAVIKKAALSKAQSLDKDDWRINLALTEEYLNDKEYSLAAEYANKSLKKYPERSILGINYALALLNMGEYKKCVKFLGSFIVIPFEGAVMGRNIYHEASLRAAFEAMKKKNYKSAIAYAKKALLWPLNLGTGKPYNPDVRLENYVIAYSYEKLGNSSDANTYYSKVMDYKMVDDQRENALLYLQILVLKENNREKEAGMMIDKALVDYPDNRYVKWVKNIETIGILESDTEEMVLSERQTSPINNKFLLLNSLLSITE